ncbi:MAG: hypothetical protein IPK80_06785 [Nannocystis sp.]|nr:hypothetical protein [Nannocystis sp.]
MANNETSTAESLMSAYLDQELDADESREFEETLASSPDARRELDELRSLLRLVKDLPEVQAPPDLYEKIARKLRRKKLLRADFWLLVALPFQVLGILMILAVAVIYTMLYLDNDPSARLEKDPTAAAAAPEGPAAGPGQPPAAPADLH